MKPVMMNTIPDMNRMECAKMSNVAKNPKINERLNSLVDMEMMPNELNKMLEEELSRDAEKMDVQLIDELLELLEAEKPAPGAKEECRRMISEKRRPERSARKSVRRSVAIAAAVIAVLVLSVGTVSAFQWSFLWKLFAPLAETFGIYSASNLESDASVQPPQEGMVAYTLEDTFHVQMDYETLEDMPVEAGGFRIVPAWVPERFSFAQGSIYEDPEIIRATVTYAAGEDLLSVVTVYHLNDSAVSGYVFEKKADELGVEHINGVDVNFYINATEETLYATWVGKNSHCLVSGTLSQSEMITLIEGMTA